LLKYILLFLFLILRIAPASAASVSVGTGLYKPFIMVDQTGAHTGIYHDFLKELIKKAGLYATFEPLPIPRVLNKARNGKFDLFLFISNVPEAKENYTEVTKFHHLRVLLIADTAKLDLKKAPFSIGKAEGTFCKVFSPEEEKLVHFIEYANTEQAVKMLLSKRLAAVCTTRELFFYELGKSAYANMKFFEHPEYHDDFDISLFANKKMPHEHITALQKAASELEQKQTISGLYKKYRLRETASH
jgi:ABC-type amino acid transport substrate-binding protein